ncbi:MAG: archaellin/type IV pilin N-terminal domain-containing protein [Candidatus Bathyarchaeia archaeon]
MGFIRSKRGVSPVIATLLMINIALVLGVIVYTWGSGIFQSWAASSSLYFQNRGEYLEEAIALENLRYDPTPDPGGGYKFNLTVRNIGKRDAWIASIYVNGTNIISQVSLAWNSTGKIVNPEGSGLHKGYYHLLVGDSITFAFQNVAPGFNEGDLLIIVVGTDRGNRVAENWRATG